MSENHQIKTTPFKEVEDQGEKIFLADKEGVRCFHEFKRTDSRTIICTKCNFGLKEDSILPFPSDLVLK